MEVSLKHRATSGVIWSSVQKFGTMTIMFLANIVLARLLTPEDYGLIGVLMIFISLSNTFIDGGFGSALIQKREPSNKDYSTIFYWNLLLSLLLYTVLILTAPRIASFYHIPLLEKVLQIQGFVLVINALGIVQNNQLRKKLAFKTLAKINITSAVFALIIAIILAKAGWGVWALVTQQLLLSIINTILLWIVGNWKPLLVFSFDSFKELFSFGGFILLSNLINTFVNNVQGLLIGRFFSAGTMGLYTQAKKLEEVAAKSIASVIEQVSYPVLAEVQNDRVHMSDTLRSLVIMLSYLTFPLMILLIIIAEPLITLLYSTKWIECVPYFKILCIAGIAVSLQGINYYAVAAIGKSRELFRWTIIKRILGIGYIIIGFVNFKITGLLWGMVIGSYTIYIINAFLVSKHIGYKFLLQLRDLAPIVLVSIITAIISSRVGSISSSWLSSLFIMIITYGLIYVIISYLLKLRSFSMFKTTVLLLIDRFRNLKSI